MKDQIISLIDSGKFNKVLENFNKATGFCTGIIDLEGNILFRSGWQRICTDFHRLHPETRCKCIKSDTQLSKKKSDKPLKYNLYNCLNGMTDVSVPLIIDKCHVANLFSGQFFLNEPDTQFFKKQANKYGFNEADYLKALSEVPVKTRDQLEIVIDFLISLADLIVDMATENYKQQSLSENLFKGEEIAGFGNWEFNLDSGAVTPSKGALRIYGALDFKGPHTIALTQSLALPEYRPMLDRAMHNLITKNIPYDVEFKIRRLDNHKIVDVHAKAKYNKEKKLVFGVLHDISRRKKLEEQLFHSRKMDLIGRLAGGVAHDYNNAISAIMGFTQFAIDRIESSPWAESLTPALTDLDEVLAASKSAADITSQLLSFSRINPIAPEVINLGSSLKKIYNMLRRLIGEDILLDLKPASDLWPVELASSQFDQLMINLCVNARDAILESCKKTECHGKITIQAQNTYLSSDRADDFIQFLSFKPGNYVHISVHDTGCGIDEEKQLKIFEPFYTTKSAAKGTGLGLATVYGIIKQNHGYINLYSQPEKGATFNIYIPQHEAFIDNGIPDVVSAMLHDTDDLKISYKKNSVSAADIINQSVLVVEDDPAVLKMTEKMLSKYGFTVLSATTPGKAIGLAFAHEEQIDLLITDIILPELSGQKLAEKLKKKYPDMKCLFMSGYTPDEMKQKTACKDEGYFDNFLQKPFKVSELKESIERVMEKNIWENKI